MLHYVLMGRSCVALLFGVHLQVPPGPVGDAVVQSINETSVVETVVPDACVKAMLSK